VGLIMPRVEVWEKKANAVLLGVALLLWAALGWFLIQAARTASNVMCFDDARAPLWPGEWRYYAMAATCLAAFVAGRFTLYVRYYARKMREVGQQNGPAAAGQPPLAPKAELVTQAALVLLFALFTLALAYETLGLYQIDFHAGNLHPITTYTRCAIDLAPRRSTFVAASLSYLLGHWLWFRA